jgi:hypothetical protein
MAAARSTPRVRRRIAAAGIASMLATALSVAQTGPVVAPAASTKAMATWLAELAGKVDPTVLWFNVNDARADLLAVEVEKPRALAGDLRFRLNYARELAFAGRYPAALDQVTRLLERADEAGPEMGGDFLVDVLMVQATTFLRMGEEQNCAEGHNSDSCLLPIRGRGVHARRDGSAAAVRVLERILRIDPGNLRARWLLNIAHMTLGSYPDGVAPAWLIPPGAFAAAQPMPRFQNVAASVGLGLYGLSGGAALEDFDRDGLVDLVVSSIGFSDPIRVFRNDGNGRFSDRTAAAGLPGINGGLNLVHADYDNDGLADVLVLRGAWMESQGRFPVSLLRNAGNLHFIDVTKAAGLAERLAPTQTAAWLDFDGDGWLDLFVGRESTPQDRHPCELYRNNRDGTFTEMAREAGVALVGYVKAAVSGDYDNDGRPDLFVSIADAANVLLHNDGRQPDGTWRFSDVSAHAGVQAPVHSFPAFFFDYDNDGWLDLFVAAFKSGAEAVAAEYLRLPVRTDHARLYHNERNGTFRDVSVAMGVATAVPTMGLNYGDLDNDGWLDFYMGTGNPDFSTLVPKRMYRNDGGRRFLDVTTAGNFGHLQKGHAIAWADVDNDGDQDIFEQMGGAYQADRAYSVLYENPGTRNGWIGLEFEGTAANRSAIGARVKVTLRTPAGSRTLHRTVGTGGSFGSSTLRQEIGLGDATGIAQVEVRWPGSGRVQLVRGLERGRRYQVREGRMAPVLLDRPRFTLSRESAPHTHP